MTIPASRRGRSSGNDAVNSKCAGRICPRRSASQDAAWWRANSRGTFARIIRRRKEPQSQMSVSNEESGKRPTWLRWLAIFLFFVPMFPFVAYRAGRLVQAQDSDDPEDLIEEIHKMNRLSWLIRGKHSEMRLSDRAQIAKQRVLQNRLKEAQQEFSAIREELRTKDSDKAKYLRYYCNYWLANIRGDWGQAEYELRQAEKAPKRSRILWLPEPKGKDDLDIVFDQGLLEAAEGAGMTVEQFVREQVIKN